MEQFWKDPHFTVRWDEIPAAGRWSGEWNEFRHQPRRNSLRYLILWHHKSEDGGLKNIDFPPNLVYLELNWSNAVDIGPLPASLRRLEAHYCTKLKSASGLAACPDLRHLRLNTCRKFRDLPAVLTLKKLEGLSLNACGELPDLKFLAGLPQLRDFRFVDTNVADGDLSPLLSHPKLESVGTLDKKHYTHKAAEVEAALAARLIPAARRRTRRRRT